MNTLKRIVNVKGWKKKTKIVTIVVIIAIIVASILLLITQHFQLQVQQN